MYPKGDVWVKRILVVTSTKLEEAVRSQLEPPEGYQIEVWGLPIDVVALLRPKSLAKLLELESERRKTKLTSFDYVLVSGMIPGDMREVAEKIGVPVYKGTKTLSELKVMIRNLNDIEKLLDPVRPLESELKRFMFKSLVDDLRSIEYEEAFKIGDLRIPLRGPPAYLGAEIMDNEPLEEKLNKASQVADYVIIGSTSTEPRPSKVPSLIKVAERYFKTIAFDSMYSEELREACKMNVDLIMSLDEAKAEEVSCEAVVAIPGNYKEGFWPLSADEKVESLKRTLKKVGAEKVVIDPVLSPPWNLLESLVAYKKVSKELKYPIMMGLSNVTELVDFDSPGVNSLLVTMGMEVGTSLFMVTEHSDKCVDSWYETKVAIALNSVAKKRNTLPKDLGLDMLILKEKRLERVKFQREGEKVEVKDHEFPLEGSVVRIWVDDGVKVVAERGGKKYFLEGDPYLIGKTLVARGIIKEPSHALYVGWELQKAYLADKLNKSYIQDEELKFESSKEKWSKLREGTKN